MECIPLRMATASNQLRFESWSSLVETQFWTKLAQLKLEELQLSEEPLALTGAQFSAHAQHNSFL